MPEVFTQSVGLWNVHLDGLAPDRTWALLFSIRLHVRKSLCKSIVTDKHHIPGCIQSLLQNLIVLDILQPLTKGSSNIILIHATEIAKLL